jgi:hypothetical protein
LATFENGIKQLRQTSRRTIAASEMSRIRLAFAKAKSGRLACIVHKSKACMNNAGCGSGILRLRRKIPLLFGEKILKPVCISFIYFKTGS